VYDINEDQLKLLSYLLSQILIFLWSVLINVSLLTLLDQKWFHNVYNTFWSRRQILL